MKTSQNLVALTRDQHTGLYFISQNEGVMLPSGRSLPEPIMDLRQMGLIASEIVEQSTGRQIEFVGFEGESKMAWKLTDSGREILSQLGIPAAFEA